MKDQIATADVVIFGPEFDNHVMRGHARLGGYFEVPLISHVEGNLYQGGVPMRGSLALPDKFKHVFSMVDGWWSYEPGSYEYHGFTLYDDLAQAMEQVDEIAAQVAEALKDGPTLVHCQAGLNRSGLVAARTLMLRGNTADEAIKKVRKRSDMVLCNSAFEAWLRSFDAR